MTVALGLKRVQSAATAGFRNDQASPATVHANWMPHPHCGVCGIVSRTGRQMQWPAVELLAAS